MNHRSSIHIVGNNSGALDYFNSQVINNIPGAFYTCDSEGRITSYNQAAVDLWGRAPELGKDFWYGSWKIFKTDGNPLTLEECPMAITLKEGKPVLGTEIIVERPDGVRKNILPNPKPIFDSLGKLQGAFNILVDITESKQIDQRIRESEYFLQKLISSSEDCIKVLDLDGRLLSMSEGGAAMIEIEEVSSFIGGYWLDLWEGKDKEEAIKILDQAKKGKTGKFIGYFPTLKTKSPRWWEVVLTPISGSDGKPERILGISRDITEQKLLQDELHEKNKKLETLNQIGKAISGELELSKLAQTITDAATKICRAEFGAFLYNISDQNEASSTLYALSGADVDIFAAFPGCTTEELFFSKTKGKSIFRSDDIRNDVRCTDINIENYISYQVTSYLAVPVISRTGEVIGGLFFGHSEAGIFTKKSEDIIAAIASQAAIAMDNAKLYEASKADKEQLSKINDELYLKNLELHRINVDLDNFIYTASHDLKAPISNIEGLIDTLTTFLKDPNTSRHDINAILHMMNASINRFSKTINDLATITRIQKDKEEGTTEKVNIAQLVEDIKIVNSDWVQKEKAAISVNCNECAEIQFSRKNLESVLYNLISNAVKYKSPKRMPVIHISTEKTDKYVILKVTDNGLGLDEHKQKKLFSMFKRFHDHVEGTGIGLYLIKRIVTNSGGKIEIESQADSGSTFKVYFKI